MGELPLKIAVLSDAISNRNGVGSYYHDLCEHLSPHLRDIRLYCPSQQAEDPNQGWRIPMPGDKTQHIYVPRWGKVYRELREMSPDVIVIPSVGPFSALGLAYAWRNGTPVCVGHHTDFEELARLYWRPALAQTCRSIIRMMSGFLLRCGQMVVTNSLPMSKTATLLGARNVRLVGTPLTREFVQTPPHPLRAELSSVLFLGRLAKEKNITHVLDAARQLPHVRFIIAGDGPLREEVEAAAAECPNLDYRGWLQRGQVRAVLDECDMLLLPSSVEAFGTVALEAMSRQRLVLMSQQCGFRDWPELAQHVFVMADGESLAAAISRVATVSRGTRMLCAQQGRLAAQAYLQRTLEQWLGIFSELCELSPPVTSKTLEQVS